MNDQTLPTPSNRSRDRTLVGFVAGGLLVAAVGATGGYLLRGHGTASDTPAATTAATATPPTTVATTSPTTPTDEVAPPAPAVRSVPKPAPVRSAPVQQAPVATVPQTVAQAPACSNCGTVESVRAFERKGEGSGVGAVAGGVVGGLLGNRMGGGNGRTAMTVLGAVGGGLAGNEIEKRHRAETYYEVQVRLDDGSTRTITQKTAPATGSRVIVEGSTLRAAS